MSDPNEWVTLGEAAEILGVHPATVRSWADSGDLQSKRTPGGHRRFRRRDLLQWAGSKETSTSPSEAQLMLQSALGRARLEVGDGQLEEFAWYDQFNETTRQAHRQLGRRLLEALTTYLFTPESRDGIVEEIRAMGAEYACLSIDHAISLPDSVRAFLFFRDLLTESMIQMAELLSLRTPRDWSSRLREVNTITDELLLALIVEYQEHSPR
jgi:excisionase family DNA binding protein